MGFKWQAKEAAKHGRVIIPLVVAGTVYGYKERKRDEQER